MKESDREFLERIYNRASAARDSDTLRLHALARRGVEAEKRLRTYPCLLCNDDRDFLKP